LFGQSFCAQCSVPQCASFARSCSLCCCTLFECVEKVNGEPFNIEFDKFTDVKDPDK